MSDSNIFGKNSSQTSVSTPLLTGDFKPREKLLKFGPSSLSDAELLAIFLRTGSVGKPVIALANQLLKEFGSLYPIMTAEKSAFKSIKGVGDAKLAQLRAIAELGKRFFNTQLTYETVIENPQAMHDYLKSLLSHEEREIFVAIFLDNQHRILQTQQMFAGSIASVEVHPREIVKEALKLNAAAVILSHNHPSGCSEPSIADREITERIQNACLLLNIRLLDHLVIGKGNYVSFAERGWL